MNDNKKNFDSVHSVKVRAGRRRTYYFDVKQTKGDDYYVTLTESTRRSDDNGFDRHKIFLYKEDFNRFVEGLNEAVNHVKNDLMPDYDYDEFDRKHEEWEQQRVEEAKSTDAAPVAETSADTSSDTLPESEDDMSW